MTNDTSIVEFLSRVELNPRYRPIAAEQAYEVACDVRSMRRWTRTAEWDNYGFDASRRNMENVLQQGTISLCVTQQWLAPLPLLTCRLVGALCSIGECSAFFRFHLQALRSPFLYPRVANATAEMY